MNKNYKIALIGNPNSGKTTLYNSLTGSHAYVGNWPGVTVEKRSGKYHLFDVEAEITDLPGVYSLTPFTDEEKVSRDFLLNGKVDCIIDVIDSTSLERSLYLTTQLLEINVPIVLALNMEDILLKNGEKINVAKLEEKFNLKVVEISALKSHHIESLMQVVFSQCESKRVAKTVLKFDDSDLINKSNEIYSEIDNSLFHSIKALEGDSLEKELNPKLYAEVNRLKNDIDFLQEEANQRYDFILTNLDEIKEVKSVESSTFSDKVDMVLTHKIWGIPICLLIIFFMFELTFSSDILFLNAFGVFKGGFNSPLRIIGSGDGINSLGVILSNSISALTNLITNLFSDFILVKAPFFVTSLVINGILNGFFTLLNILPQILLLYLLFSILEDSGYMSRIAFMLDRIFRPLGISGRAIIPMIMGFGCSVTAILNCRTLQTKKEKTKVIRTIPFFTCSAKTTLVTTICGCLLAAFNIKFASLILYAIYILGVIIAILSIYYMNKTTQIDKSPAFIMELPNYHFPQPKALFIHVLEKAKHYIKKAATIIIISNFIIFIFTRITFSFEYLGKEVFICNDDNFFRVNSLNGIDKSIIDDLINRNLLTTNKEYIDYQTAIDLSIPLKTIEIIPEINRSILGEIGQFISVILTPMGLGFNTTYTPQIKANGNSFAFPLALISGLVAKENVIATLSTIGGSIQDSILTINGVNAIKSIALSSNVVSLIHFIFDDVKYQKETIASLISFVMLNITTIPCFAAVAVSKSELDSKKSFKFTIIFWLLVSYCVGCLTYLVITNWWTIFVLLALIIITILILHFYSEKIMKFFSKVKMKKKNRA